MLDNLLDKKVLSNNCWRYTMSGDKFTFLCRDGNVSGNRYILTSYSRVLADAFDSCQGGRPAINLKTTSSRDLKCLLQVLYSLTYAEVSNPRLTGLQNVARLLDVDLTLRNGRNGFIRVMASLLPFRGTKITSAVAVAATAALSAPSPYISSTVKSSHHEKFKHSSEKTGSPMTPGSPQKDPRIDSNRVKRVDQGSQKNSSIANDGTQTDPELEMEMDLLPLEKSVVQEERRLSVDLDDEMGISPEESKVFASELSLSHQQQIADHDVKHSSNNLSLDTSHNNSVFSDQFGTPSPSSRIRKNGPGAGLFSTKKHYTKTANKDEYTCNLCQFKVKCWASIKAHIETTHYHLEFQCKQCPFTSIWRADTIKHIRNFHKSRSSSEDTYIVRQRNMDASGSEEMSEAPRLAEPGEGNNSMNDMTMNEELVQSMLNEDLLDEEDELDEEFDLPVGNGNDHGKPFERFSSRIPDINKDCYEVTKLGNNKRVYKCLSCSKECKTYCGIREHQYSTHYGYMCICNHCDVKYKSRSNMFKHLSLAHQIIKNFTQHFGYYIEDGHQKVPQIPQETIDSSGKFKCRICANNFSEKEIIINHLVYKHRIKSDVSPFFEEAN